MARTVAARERLNHASTPEIPRQAGIACDGPDGEHDPPQTQPRWEQLPQEIERHVRQWTLAILGVLHLLFILAVALFLFAVEARELWNRCCGN